MYKLAHIGAMLFLLVAPIAAHGQGRFSLFGGFSYTNYAPPLPASPNALNPPPVQSLEGWNASLGVKVFHVLEVVADFSGHYGKETVGLACPLLIVTFCVTDNENVRVHSFLLGPQVSFSVGRFAPFARVLAGDARLREALFNCGCLLPNGQAPPNSITDNSFAYIMGGGLDYRVSHKRFYLRAQADALHTQFSKIGAIAANHRRTSLRLSGGIVFRF